MFVEKTVTFSIKKRGEGKREFIYFTSIKIMSVLTANVRGRKAGMTSLCGRSANKRKISVALDMNFSVAKTTIFPFSFF